MNKPKIIFILNSIHQQRCIKRIEDFIAHGYEVEAYGFKRLQNTPNPPKDFTINIIGEFTNTLSYWKRFVLMIQAIRSVVKKHKHENVLYYYFLLDVAIAARLINQTPYIYECSDLMHTYMNKMAKTVFNWIDKYIIRHSVLTVFTSEGFSEYYFPNNTPKNVCLIPNKLNKRVTTLPTIHKKELDINHLHIGFVGGARYHSIVNFATCLVQQYPQHTFHFFGTILDTTLPFDNLEQYSNCVFHGPFISPDDLPTIYSQIDLVLATYDISHDNVRYAEPNKLYEAIYFETPIIVSQHTFLAKRVKDLSIGFDIDPLSNQDICALIDNLTIETITNKKQHCQQYGKENTINNTDGFFQLLESTNTNE